MNYPFLLGRNMAKNENDKDFASETTKDIQGWSVKDDIFEEVKGRQKSRVDLDVDKFEELIRQKGSRINVYRTLYCPQIKSIDGGEHEIDCTLCNGSGFLDTRPIKTIAYIQNQDLQKIPLAEGFLDGNSVRMTFPIGIELQYFTKVELLDHSDIFYEHVKRSHGNLDRLKYSAKRVNVVIDNKGIEYFCNNHFTLDPNGDILWKANKGPNKEQIYSVHYEAAVQFRAVKALNVNRFTQVKVPGGIKHVKLQEQWVLQKEFLVRRHGVNGEELLPNPIHKPDED